MSHDMGAPAAPKKSKLPLILGIIIGGGLLCVACCGGVLYWGYSMGTKPLEASTAAMNADPAFTDKLGSPIEFDLNGMNIQAQNTTATVQFKAKGPKGTAQVNATVDAAGGDWKVQELTAECSDGTTLTIP